MYVEIDLKLLGISCANKYGEVITWELIFQCARVPSSMSVYFYHPKSHLGAFGLQHR